MSVETALGSKKVSLERINPETLRYVGDTCRFERFRSLYVQDMWARQWRKAAPMRVAACTATSSRAAGRGLLVRHLVLPENIAGTDGVLEILAEEVSPNTYVNLMDHYRPCYRPGAGPIQSATGS